MKFRSIIFILMILILLPFNSCKSSSQSISKNTNKLVKNKVYNAYNLIKNQPTPELKYSLERHILSRRIKEWNNPDKMLYLYIFTPTNIVYMVTIKGKLSSTSKRLSPPFMKINCWSGGYEGDCIVPAPDAMGVWGHSAPAKVGITTANTLIEIGGFTGYVLTETPLQFSKKTNVVKIVVTRRSR